MKMKQSAYALVFVALSYLTGLLHNMPQALTEYEKSHVEASEHPPNISLADSLITLIDVRRHVNIDSVVEHVITKRKKELETVKVKNIELHNKVNRYILDNRVLKDSLERYVENKTVPHLCNPDSISGMFGW